MDFDKNEIKHRRLLTSRSPGVGHPRHLVEGVTPLEDLGTGYRFADSAAGAAPHHDPVLGFVQRRLGEANHIAHVSAALHLESGKCLGEFNRTLWGTVHASIGSPSGGSASSPRRAGRSCSAPAPRSRPCDSASSCVFAPESANICRIARLHQKNII